MRHPVRQPNGAPQPPHADSDILASSAITDCNYRAAVVPGPATIDATAHGSPLAGPPAAAPATVDADAPASLPDSPQGPALASIDEAAWVSPHVGEAELRLLVEDQSGVREVINRTFTPGRRYSIGKDRSADIVVEGTYTSRRHCELWLDQGRAWIADLGSTNGTRLERGGRVLAVCDGSSASSEPHAVRVEVVAGAEIVLAAEARGPATDYPRIRLDRDPTTADLATPLPPSESSQRIPSASLVHPPAAASRYIVEATTGEGVRAFPLEISRLPWSVGRSRRSAMIVPRIHEGVSGHHIDIVALDEEGAEVLVHGANGVRQGPTAYGAGERFHWCVGEVLEFGRASAQEPAFTLELFQHASAATVRE